MNKDKKENKDNNDENVPRLDIVEVLIFHRNIA